MYRRRRICHRAIHRRSRRPCHRHRTNRPNNRRRSRRPTNHRPTHPANAPAVKFRMWVNDLLYRAAIWGAIGVLIDGVACNMSVQLRLVFTAVPEIIIGRQRSSTYRPHNSPPIQRDRPKSSRALCFLLVRRLRTRFMRFSLRLACRSCTYCST